MEIEGETEIVLRAVRRKVSQTLNSVVKYEGKKFSQEFHKIIDSTNKNIQNSFNINAKKFMMNKIGVADTGVGSNIVQSVTNVITNLLGGRRAIGGQVETGKAYLVGEQGPEMFTPSNHGTITRPPQNRSTPSIIMNITTPDADSFRKSQRQIIAEFMNGLSGVR